MILPFNGAAPHSTGRDTDGQHNPRMERERNRFRSCFENRNFFPQAVPQKIQPRRYPVRSNPARPSRSARLPRRDASGHRHFRIAGNGPLDRASRRRSSVTDMALKIIIQTECDFTPAGKRRAAIAYASTRAARIHWYISGKVYRSLPVSDANVTLSKRWVDRA